MDILDIIIASKLNKSRDGYRSINKCADYLYCIEYDSIDYNYANKYFENNDASAPSGACSSVCTDKYYGRNFDWKYDNSAEFVVHVQAHAGRYESHGIAGGIEEFTDEFVASGTSSDNYRILPFRLRDGQNEHGLICSTNVVPTDYGTNISVPTGEQTSSICGTMLVRYILDHFKTALEACEYIAEHVSVWFSQSLIDMGYEQHYMLKDPNSVYCLEFINNEAVYFDISEHPYLTNFYIYGLTLNDDGTVYTPYTQDSVHNAIDTNGVTENGCGLERWNIIANAYSDLTDKDSMESLMESIKYSNAYTITDADDVWYTEFVHINDLGTGTPYTDYSEVVGMARDAYSERTRDDENPVWQTVHSVIYDVASRRMYVKVQEDEFEYEFDELSTETWTFTLFDDTTVTKRVVVKE